MKDIKQIRKQFDLITEKEEKEDKKLSALVRAGLYDAKKLPALKRALDKSADKITAQEKRMLINLLDSLISQVVSDDQVYRKVRQNVHNVTEAAKMDTYSKFDPRYKAGWPTDKEMPSVLILKRKAIRVYPDNQKVALYYSQALDKYVTIPYNDIQMGLNESKKDDEDDKRINKELKKNPYSITKDSLVAGKIVRKNKPPLSTRVRQLTKSIVAQHKDISSRVGAAGAIGVIGNRAVRSAVSGFFRKRAVNKALANRKANKKSSSSVPKPTESVSTKAPSSPVPKVTPKPKAVKSVVVTPPPERKDKALQNRMKKILDKNGPSHEFSQATLKRAATNETFQYNLQMIREARQYGAADATLDAASFLPGPVGSAASLASAGMSISRGDYVGAALDAAGALPIVGYAAKAAKVAKLAKASRAASKISKGGKITDPARLANRQKAVERLSKMKGGNKGGKWLRRGGKTAKLAGAALGAAGGNTGENGSSDSTPKTPNYQFSAKPETSSSFASNKASADAAIRQRDMQLNRQSQKALMREAPAYNFTAKVKTSRSERSRSTSSQEEKDRQLNRQSQRALTRESNVLDILKSIVENNLPEQTIQINENKITINNTVAKKLLNVYESINKSNKKKMEQMLNESATSFNKVLTFAVRQ